MFVSAVVEGPGLVIATQYFKVSNHLVKSIKNLTFWKLHGGSGRLQGGPAKAPGRPRGGSREAAGRLWEILGGSTRVQKAPGRLREATGRLPGAVLGASWDARRPCLGRLEGILEAS